MMMKNFKIGQVVKIVGDNFVDDTHGFELGTLGIVEELVPPTSFEELPPMIQFVYAINDLEGIDLPARVHLTILNKDGSMNEELFANVLPEDIELVARAGDRVELLETDVADGFTTGDIFTVDTDVFGELVFIDNDGDERFLNSFEYRVVE